MIYRGDNNENPDEGENETGQRTGTISSDDNSYERRRQSAGINPALGTSDQILPSVQVGDGDGDGGGGGGSGSGSDVSGSRRANNTYDEPVAGPSGINYGASTSRVYFPSPFEDDEEGKRPKKKMCGSQIDYGDYDLDDESYSRVAFGFDYRDYDLDDPNNNTDNDTDNTNIDFIADQALFGHLLHHGYTKAYHYLTGEPRGDISQADWNEAGPSGINVIPGASATDLFPAPGPSEPNDNDTSVSSEQGTTDGGTLPSDSDLSSSCSHRSLVDRYTHMNISGCEDQTDEECNFDETDLSDEESQH